MEKQAQPQRLQLKASSGSTAQKGPWNSEEGVVSSGQGRQLGTFRPRGHIHSRCFVLFLFCNFYLFVSFIEVYFTHHKTQLLQMYTSLIFSDFTEGYKYQHKSVLEHFQPPRRSLVPCAVSPHSHLHPSATTNLLSDSKFAGLCGKGWKLDLKLITGEVQERGTRVVTSR